MTFEISEPTPGERTEGVLSLGVEAKRQNGVRAAPISQSP